MSSSAVSPLSMLIIVMTVEINVVLKTLLYCIVLKINGSIEKDAQNQSIQYMIQP
jgi:hypothetical protein